jgi:hypothetical protein
MFAQGVIDRLPILPAGVMALAAYKHLERVPAVACVLRLVIVAGRRPWFVLRCPSAVEVINCQLSDRPRLWCPQIRLLTTFATVEGSTLSGISRVVVPIAFWRVTV